MTINKNRLPAEWEEQCAIMLCWPHKYTDWAYMLDDVQRCFTEIATAITLNGENLVIIAPDCNRIETELAHLPKERIKFLKIATNDTWARDTCAITTIADGNVFENDFKFNGWGLKFAANFDNLITSELFAKTDLFEGSKYVNHLNFVLEGGAIESDGKGTILTTSNCLLSPNRNGAFSKSEIERYIKDAFGAERVLWLDHGALEGDDTDSHIDTLARFAPNDTILYAGTDNTSDSHYCELKKMESQLAQFKTIAGAPYNLAMLPIPEPIFDEEGLRLPATYANFLIGNGFVLVPTYRQPEADKFAIEQIGKAFKGRKIIGIDCVPLIQQHGSLHCVTMQFPAKSLNI